MPDSNTIDVDLMSKVSFQRTNWYDLPSCLQSDYTNEEVTFWYFVPVQTNTNWGNQFMVSGKAVYKP
jgi:hypothetical protein